MNSAIGMQIFAYIAPNMRGALRKLDSDLANTMTLNRKAGD